jgi:sugar porter (SP) family MFS transporter
LDPVKAREGNAAYTLLISAVAAAGGLLFGFDTAIVAGAQVFFAKEFGLDALWTGIAVSSLLGGCVLGASIAGFLSDRFGRKKVLILSAILFALSAVLAAIPRDVNQFMPARLLGGLGIGMTSMLSPMYIAEVSPAEKRGRLVTLNQMAIITGILLAYVAAYLLAEVGPNNWRWMFALASVPALVFGGALLCVPESPRWLVKQGRAKEAFAALDRVGGSRHAAAELAEIEETLAHEKGGLSELLRPFRLELGTKALFLRIPLLFGIFLAVFQQITGINTILYYAPTIFLRVQEKVAGATDVEQIRSAMLASMVVGLVNFIFTAVAIAVIDRLGRKPLLLIGSAGMAVSLLLLGIVLVYYQEAQSLVLITMLSYVAFFAIGLGPVVWLLLSEIFPTKIRGRSMSIATISLWIACLVVSITFLKLVDAFTLGGAFWLYSGMCAVTFLFVLWLIPETKGRSLEEIERFWIGT